jgi:HNH endonuclease
MHIEERKILIRDIVDDYFNDAEEGVRAYHDQLDVRPPYQREFVYKDAQRDEVIRTVLKGLPLNVMYWVDRGEEYDDDPDTPRYEVMDGQQRTISICEYFDGAFSVDDKYFSNLPSDQREQFLNYPLFVYQCQGTDSEKLNWFRIINIAGEQLTDQELRNAVYAGPWVTSAKVYFSKSGCPAYQLAGDYLRGSSIRQEYLQTAISWMASIDGISIEEFMARHQDDANAVNLWNYFRSVIEWVQAIFPKRRKEMAGLPWGIFYNQHHERTDLDPKALEERVSHLMADEDVSKKSGVYEYLLTDDERALSIRAFTERDRRAAYERQKGICPMCGEHFELAEMHADHIVPWSKGGHTTPENCQMLCRDDNLRKSNI